MSDERDAKLEGNWDQAKGRIREAWGALTDDDLEKSKGSWEQLVGTVRERTGDSIESVERRLNEMFDSLRDAGSSDRDR